MIRTRSLRFRMMLLFSTLVGGLLAVTFLVCYLMFAGVIRAQLDRRLIDAAKPVLADLKPDPVEDDPKTLNSSSEDDISKLDISGEYFELLDASGRVLQRSKNFANQAFYAGDLPAATSTPVYRSLQDAALDQVRIVLIPFERGTEHRVLLLAMQSSDADQELAQFRRVIALLLPLSLLLAAAVSVWYTGRALRPIVDLTRHAAAMTEQAGAAVGVSLWKPLQVANPDDELGRLAATFNRLFARVDSTVQQMRQFVADASHELRTPLTVLQGETELVLSRVRAPEEYRRSLESLDGELKTLTRIVKGLFTLSMGDAGQLTIAREPLYLHEVLEESCAIAAPLARAKQISIECARPPEIPYDGDPAFLRQLFLIFLENAIKYSPANECIRVELSRREHVATVRFEDRGIGIAPQHLPRIFDRFYRVAPQGGGMFGSGGLGLAIAQVLVRAHGGSIECTSVPGQGSIFTVTLPLAGASGGHLPVPEDKQELRRI